MYHLIARSINGLTVQILAGLITYLLLALYFRIRHNEKVSIKRVRQLRSEIRNKSRVPEKKLSFLILRSILKFNKIMQKSYQTLLIKRIFFELCHKFGCPERKNHAVFLKRRFSELCHKNHFIFSMRYFLFRADIVFRPVRILGNESHRLRLFPQPSDMSAVMR